MVRNTLKMLMVALIAAFTLSSVAEAATPRKTRHRVKHSSRVSSGVAATTGSKPAPKKKAAAPAKSQTRAKASMTQPAKKAPAKRRPTTKPH